MSWSKVLLDAVAESVADDPGWAMAVSEAMRGERNIHLAILNEPFLRHIMAGRKTMESRFGKRAVSPYQAVEAGDVLILKRSSGPVVGMCTVANASFYQLDDATRESLREEFGVPMCATSVEFWDSRRDKNFATLMKIEDVRPLPDLRCGKRDRRGWVVLGPTSGAAAT